MQKLGTTRYPYEVYSSDVLDLDCPDKGQSHTKVPEGSNVRALSKVFDKKISLNSIRTRFGERDACSLFSLLRVSPFGYEGSAMSS